MKKITTLLAGLCLVASTATAQLADGATAPNFTLTDLNGTSWDLYTVLGQGKSVVIDVSATWCGPCWAYHNTHALENFYSHYGPTGTVSPNRAMVFFVEGDAATTVAQLNGTGTTQGNWVAGTPYPIFNPVNPQCNTFNTNYAIAFFPTIYLICPDKKVNVLTQPTEAQIVTKMNANCASGFNLDATTATCLSTMACSASFSPVVAVKNAGQTSLSSCTITYKVDNGTASVYNWTGSLASNQTVNTTLPAITVSTAGSHTLTVTTSAPNGSTDQNTGNDSKTYPFMANIAAAPSPPASETFASTTFPVAGWVLNNPDNDVTWKRSTSAGGFGISNSCMVYDANNYQSTGEIDEITIAPVNLGSISGAVSAKLEFDVAYAPFDATNFEKLEVFISADCGLTWTSVYNKSGATLGTAPANSATLFVPTASQWRKENINLTSYIGQQKVFCKFKATNGWGNDIYIDNINISFTVGIPTTIIDNTLNIYPNPVKENLFIDFEMDELKPVAINIYNTLGELTSTKALQNSSTGHQQLKIETADLAKGLYILEIKTNESSISRKFIIE